MQHDLSAGASSVHSRVVSVLHRVAHVAAGALIGAGVGAIAPYAAMVGVAGAALGAGWKLGDALQSDGGGMSGLLKRVAVHAVSILAAAGVGAGLILFAPSIATLALGSAALGAAGGFAGNLLFDHEQHEAAEAQPHIQSPEASSLAL